MLVCCWFDLGLKLLKVENGTFENRTIAGNSHYLVPFGNRTIAGTALIETALTGDPLYYVPVNDRKCVFHFRPKPKPKSEKHLVFGRIPKPKPKVQIYVKKGGNFAKFQVSNDISN